MKETKFRQAIWHPVTKRFVRWHYWGLIDNTFVGIDTGWYSPKQAVENSSQYTGLKDKETLTDIYEGDIIDMEGKIRGNIYESPEVYKALSTCVVAGMGYEDWENTKQRLVRQGKLVAEQSNLPQILRELG